MSKLFVAVMSAIVGFGVYELVRRWLLEEQELAASLRQIGPVKGAALTAGGHGAVQKTLESDGGRVSHRVGRGVVRRG
jgi:hypothetical protein